MSWEIVAIASAVGLSGLYLFFNKLFKDKLKIKELASEKAAEEGRADRAEDFSKRIEDVTEAEHEIAAEVVLKIEAAEREARTEAPPDVRSEQWHAQVLREYLQHLRWNSGIPALDLGRALKQHYTWIVEVEVGSRLPTKLEALDWARACHASATMLMELEHLCDLAGVK